jgi:uncharacterized protein (TIGR02266 family)
MFDNDRDSAAAPIELRVRKVRSDEEEPLQLRRKKPRSYDLLRLDVEVSLWSESHFYAGLSGGASPAGLFVATYQPPRPGERVLVRVELLGEPIEVEGIVQWQRAASEHAPPGVGVALADLAPQARRLVDAFCAARPPMYYELENDESCIA